ncbi:sporulation membrane protein YtaF [Neobacillus sp. PS3-12]|jgi:putative sporulation protein YtaF|uniref:sporulation membrane protein YtaF n=1 Tax=Neobacillus sp. PS3-12 TaxID=3070677 RepID=UPI0027DF2590|nr:sporulation membrane protein YtaF [Neobacillus sp. PS3-12]WML51096.1 sporulation membrane protein YtaF [Neobacillus sp. PS3-12]
MIWLVILAFALSSSIDNLGVGISYGIQGIRIGMWANLIIAVICFLFSEFGIVFGKWISSVVPGIFPILIGAFLLIIIGIRIILLAVPRKTRSEKEIPKDMNKVKIILKNPERADLDQSGEIGFKEACVLGVALSANAITNGLSAGLFGLSPLAISLTAAVGSFLMVWTGVALGRKAANVRIGSFSLVNFGTIISGVILLLIACESIFFR